MALKSATGDVAEAVRNAMLRFEHLRLGHRFSQFILANLPSDYFSVQADSEPLPVGRRALEAALKNLYGTRSEYVHTLKPLTKEFLHFASHREIYDDHEKIVLSFQGLFRLVRAVIIEFVRRAEKVDHEPCAYENDNPHLLRIRFDPSVWIYVADGLTSVTCRRYLAGLVELLDQCFKEYPLKKLHSLQHVFEEGFSIRPQFTDAANVSFVALVNIGQLYLGGSQGGRGLTDEDVNLLNKPGIDALINATITGVDTEWPPAEHALQVDKYYGQRFKSQGIKVPTFIEACMGLGLAERYRLAGLHTEAQGALKRAIEDFPSLKQIRELPPLYSGDAPIRWLEIIYPKMALPNRPTLHCVGL
jgi:hypothetical protein